MYLSKLSEKGESLFLEGVGGGMAVILIELFPRGIL